MYHLVNKYFNTYFFNNKKFFIAILKIEISKRIHCRFCKKKVNQPEINNNIIII